MKQKRLGVLRILDTTGVVDEYVYTLLKGMREVATELMVFCSSKSDAATIEKLGKHAEHVFSYENENFSDGCFVTECSYKIMSGFDEVIIFDDTLYGPLRPMQEMFTSMQALNPDFWGLTRNYERVTLEGYPVPGNLQGYFVVLEKTVLKSASFKQYWAGAHDGKHFMDLLVHALSYAGFHWDAYLDTSVAKGKFPDENYDPSIWFAYDLLKRQNAPFVRTVAISNTYFLPGGDEVPRLTFEYLKKNTEYNPELIWKHLLRTQNILDIKTALHLEKILPSECALTSKNPLEKHTAAIIAHLYYPDQLMECMDYLANAPKNVDVYIVSSNEETRDSAQKEVARRGLQHFRIMEKNNRGRDFSALLVACHDILMKYDYLCFIHDKKSHAHSPVPSGRTWFYNLWSCMLESTDYIENVFRTFDAQPLLGMLVPPEPCHSEAIAGVGFTWGKNLEGTRDLLKTMGLEVPLDKDKHPITLGTAFWCRTKAMEPFFTQKYDYEDFPDEPMAIDGTICHAMERVFGYVAQAQGYYVENVMSPEFAGLRLNKLNYYMMQAMTVMRDTNIWDRRDGGVVFVPDKLARTDRNTNILLGFGYGHPTVYIYGAGVYGKSCCQILQAQGITIRGFIVTDKTKNPSKIMGIPVCEIKDVPLEKGIGVVVALKAKFRAEVVPLLLEKGLNELCFYPGISMSTAADGKEEIR